MTAEIGLPEALERAAVALPAMADAIRPANGDPDQLARGLAGNQASRVLAWLLEHEPAAGSELALAWAETPETAAAMLELAPESLPKPARKALRRALHRLRSRGVSVPEARPAPGVSTLAPLDESVDEARITAFDPQGVRLVYLATDHPAGGVRLFELALDDARGVLDFDVFEAGRGRTRRFLRDAERRERWPAVAAPSDSVRVLIARAAAHQNPERAAPRTFHEWSSRLCAAPDATETPGALVRQALGVDEQADLSGVEDWVRAGRVGPWPPPVERVRTLLDRLDEIARGVVLVSGAAREDQVAQALDAALPEVFDATHRALCADRFEETAYVWWRSGAEADARLALAAASALRAGDARAEALTRLLLETLLAPALERARQGVEEPAPETDAPSEAAQGEA